MRAAPAALAAALAASQLPLARILRPPRAMAPEPPAVLVRAGGAPGGTAWEWLPAMAAQGEAEGAGIVTVVYCPSAEVGEHVKLSANVRHFLSIQGQEKLKTSSKPSKSSSNKLTTSSKVSQKS